MGANAQQNRIQSQSSIVGDVVYHPQLISPQLKHPHDVIVWLPPSYTTLTEARFPVLYVHDGQNLMDPATAFGGQDWRLDETATELIEDGNMQEIIIVGIYNTPDRNMEYSGSRIGKKYASFIADELKPFIDSVYRTKADAANTAVMGSSLGGLISFLMAWWYPNTFSKAACLSGSFFWNHYKTVKMVRDYRGAKKPLRIYLDVGSQETLLREGYEQMVKLLQKQHYGKGTDLKFFLDRGADHNEYHWGNRAWRGLKFLFPKPRTRRRIKAMSDEQ